MDIEVRENQKDLETLKEQDEQDKKDGEELVEAQLDGPRPRNYGKICYNKTLFINSKVQPIDIKYDFDNDDNIDDLDVDDDDVLNILMMTLVLVMMTSIILLTMLLQSSNPIALK